MWMHPSRSATTRKACATPSHPCINGKDFDTSRVLDGLYIASSTHADVNADLEVGPGVGIDLEVVQLEFTVTGGLTGSLHANIDNPTNTPKIRPFDGGLTSQLFDVSGSLNAVLDATLKAGVTIPIVGFVGFDKTWTFASATLFQFNTTTIPIPADLIPPVSQPVTLYTYDSSTHTLTLNAGPNASLRGPDGLPDQEDETFTIDHNYYFFLIVPPLFGNTQVTRAYFSRYTISGMGFTQTFDGEVDSIVADMGSGNDTLTVIDQFSPTVYTLDGGDGNDTIDVQGDVQVHITGGAGDDTIEAGNGSTNPNLASSVDGGTGNDTITFGGGQVTGPNMFSGNQLANLNPGVFEITAASGDTSVDRIIIDNSSSRVDTQYEFLTLNPNLFFGAANELGILDDEGNGPIERDIVMPLSDTVTIYSGSETTNFWALRP